jgi:hypothetical protein
MILFKHPIIFISNIVKVLAICLADMINYLWNPFDKFTRSMVLKYPESLKDKATKFENNLAKFYHDGIVYDSTISWGTNFDDVGDESLWHGITVAMWAIKYSVTKDPNDLEKIRQGMIGLDLHQTAHGEPVRRLIRGVSDPLNPEATFIDDVSNDGASGHLLGIYYAWKYGDDDIRQKANVLIRGLADEILNHNYCLVGPTGNPTTYGTLIDGWLTNPMCLTLCMVILRVAWVITLDPKYNAAYEEVIEIYGSAGLYKYPKVSFLTWNNWNDDHRAVIHLSILASLDRTKGFEKGLKRIWRLNKKSGNAWIAYLCGQHFDIPKEELQPCMTLLNEFYVEDLNNLQKVNSHNPEVGDMGIEIQEYSIAEFIAGNEVATQPLPLWWTGAQDFRWQRCLYSVDDWVGIITPNQVFFGVDFLVAYWGFRQLGFIKDSD